MKNKVRLKKYLLLSAFISICILSLFLIIRVYEYKTYTNNFNNKLDMIIGTIKEKYPDISDTEIIKIINNEETTATDIFKQYGIELDKDSLILENNKDFTRFLILDGIAFIGIIFGLIGLFLIYDRKKDKELAQITKYIEEINRKNYSLKIDEISEDELSILKNEIYKTTIMLKESAENSNKDKLNLKKSLEDII